MIAPTLSADDLAVQLKSLRVACEKEGRDYDEIEISCMWAPAMGLDSISKFRDAGASRLIVPLQAVGGANPMEGLDQLGSQVIAKLG